MTPTELLQAAKEGAFYAENNTHKYVNWKEYTLVLAKNEIEKIYTVKTILYTEWIEGNVQDRIDKYND